MYVLNKDLTVKIYKGDITRSSHFDALVCGIDPNLQFNGFFAEALKKTGGDAFEDHMNKIFKKANKVKQGDVLRCKPGKLKVENIVFVVADKLIDVGNKEQKNYRDWVNNLLKQTHEWNFKRIAIPLFSTGQLQTNENELQKCAIALLQALDNFAENKSGTKLTMMEIHLVNNNDLVTSTLVKVFDVASKTRGHNVGITPSSGSDSHWKAAGKGQVTNTHLESSNKNDRHTQQHRTGDAGFSGSYRSNDTPARKEKYKKDVGSSPPKGNGAARYQTVDAKPREERHYDAVDDATGGAKYGGSGNFSDEDVVQPAFSRPKQSSTLPTDSRHTSDGGSHGTSTSAPQASKGNVLIIEED